MRWALVRPGRAGRKEKGVQTAGRAPKNDDALRAFDQSQAELLQTRCENTSAAAAYAALHAARCRGKGSAPALLREPTGLISNAALRQVSLLHHDCIRFQIIEPIFSRNLDPNVHSVRE